MTPLPQLLDDLAHRGDHHVGVAPEDWGQGRAIFGGLVSGYALRALADRIADGDRALRSVLVSFLAPVRPGELQVQTRVLRAGRSMTQAEARILQNGDEKAILVAAYGADRPSRLHVATPSPPPEIPTDDGQPMVTVEGVVPRFTRGFEYRWDPACLPFSGASQAVIRGSVRLKGGAPVDAAGVLALLDAWPAPVLTIASRPVPASTVTWMVDLLQPQPEGGWDGAGWWRFASETVGSSDGYADISGRIWSPGGQLVAVSRQLVAEFSGR